MCGLLRACVPWCVPPHGVPRPQTQEEAADEGAEQGPVTAQSREFLGKLRFIFHKDVILYYNWLCPNVNLV